jgi:NAD(P)H-hydrate repair Nnr-like enzyme with NAD(P)H-hydrate epimerase domain
MTFDQAKRKLYADIDGKIPPELCHAATEWIAGGRYSLPRQLKQIGVEWEELTHTMNTMNILAQDILLDAIYGMGTSEQMRQQWEDE